MQHIDIRAAVLARMQTLGWSQNELAKRCGLPQPTINRYCSGVRDMTGERLALVLEALGLDVAERRR